MIEIRPWLYVGRHSDPLHETLLSDHQIGAMLLLYEPVHQPGIETLYLPIQEGDALSRATIDRGLSFIDSQRQAGRHVLIACSAGISRSVLFAVAALKQAENRTLLDAFEEVRARHPRAMPDLEHWDSLCTYFGEDVPFLSIWHAGEM